jgi:hypothetical protein
MVTPRMSCTPCSRYVIRKTSSLFMAEPMPAWIASCPSIGAYVPSWPVRWSATAFAS